MPPLASGRGFTLVVACWAAVLVALFGASAADAPAGGSLAHRAPEPSPTYAVPGDARGLWAGYYSGLPPLAGGCSAEAERPKPLANRGCSL